MNQPTNPRAQAEKAGGGERIASRRSALTFHRLRAGFGAGGGELLVRHEHLFVLLLLLRVSEERGQRGQIRRRA